MIFRIVAKSSTTKNFVFAGNIISPEKGKACKFLMLIGLVFKTRVQSYVRISVNCCQTLLQVVVLHMDMSPRWRTDLTKVLKQNNLAGGNAMLRDVPYSKRSFKQRGRSC